MKRIIPPGQRRSTESRNRPPPDWRSLFHGRAAELERVIAAWRRVAGSGQPEVVTVVGMSGAGKTRLLQEFYRWLADPANGFNNGYWPEALGTSQKSLDIHPTFPPGHSVRSGSALPYLWFGIRYDNPDEPGSQPHPLLAAQDHLDPHLRYVRYVAELEKLGWDAVKEDVGGILWSVSQGAVELVPGGALLTRGKEVFGLASSIASKVKQARRSKGRAHLSQRDFREAALQQHATAVLADLERVIRARKEARTPMVFVVDDAQWGGAGGRDEPRFSDVLEFLGALLARAREEKLPLLMLATHWLAEWKQEWSTPAAADAATVPREFVDLLRTGPDPRWREYGERIAAQIEEGAEPIDFRDDRAGVILLPKIAAADLLHVLSHEHALPGVAADAQQRELLLRMADGNPRMLHELVLHLQSNGSHFEAADHRRSLAGPGLEALQDLVPGDVQEVVQRRFQTLDDALKRILEYSALQGIVFNEHLTKALATTLAHACFLDDEDLKAWFSAAETPLSFVAPEAPGVAIHRFEHDMHFRVSRRSLGRTRSEEAGARLTEILAGWIRERHPDGWSDAERAQVYELAVAVLSQPGYLLERQLARLRLILAMEKRGAIWAWLHHGPPFLRDLTADFDFRSLRDDEWEVAMRGSDHLDHRGARLYLQWAARVGRAALRTRERDMADRRFVELLDELVQFRRAEDAVAVAQAAWTYRGGDARWATIDLSDWEAVEREVRLDLTRAQVLALLPSSLDQRYQILDEVTDRLEAAFKRNETVSLEALRQYAEGMTALGEVLEASGEDNAAWAAFNGAAATGREMVGLFEDHGEVETQALERVLDQLERIPAAKRSERIEDVYEKLSARYLDRESRGNAVHQERAALERRMSRVRLADGPGLAEAEAHLLRATEILETAWAPDEWSVAEDLAEALQDLGDWRAQRQGWEGAHPLHHRAIEVLEISARDFYVEIRGGSPEESDLPGGYEDDALSGAYDRYALLAERFGHEGEAARLRERAERFRSRPDEHPEDGGVLAIFPVQAYFKEGTEEWDFLDRFLLECVEANGLTFGGGYGDGWLDGMVEVRTGLATALDQRRRVLAWLRAQEDVKGATAGLLLDGDTTEPLQDLPVADPDT